MTLFLTSEQLEEMTGYRNHTAQATWLADNGYRFDVRKDGRPNVLLEQVRERQVSMKATERKPGPDFSWMDQVG